MPKKKIQAKEKLKKAGENLKICLKESERDFAEEEYTTVVDYETNKKYCKRVVESNWGKYELIDFHSEDEENDIFKANDFIDLVKTSSSDCSHFELTSEKFWRSEDNVVPTNDIFNLDVTVLSSGLSCVPFYLNMDLTESEVSIEDKKKMDEAAAKSWKTYEPIRENFIKKLQPSDKGNEGNKEEKTLDTILNSKLDLNEGSKDESSSQSNMGTNRSEKQGQSEVVAGISKSENTDKSTKIQSVKLQTKILSDNDEDLEDWLDSVLDN